MALVTRISLVASLFTTRKVLVTTVLATRQNIVTTLLAKISVATTLATEKF
jgi:hypothetical protein